MTAGIGAYERERYRDASRMLKTVVDAVPNAPSARELLGLSQYHLGHWKAALGNLEAFSALTGSVDQHPVRMDCQRALGRPKLVEALFIELRQGSPDAEVLSEGRLVLAGTRADGGDLADAVSLLVEAGAGRMVRGPAERHLRQWYVLGDLMERSGDVPKARELFSRIHGFEADAYDVVERLESLGPPTTAQTAEASSSAPSGFADMDLQQLLGKEADSLLDHEATAFPKDWLSLPSPSQLDDIFIDSDRSPTVLRNLGLVYNTGRLAGTGYLSILPVDQGIEHSAAASFSKNPAYFDPAHLCDLALAGDCNAIATTVGGLGIVSRRYVHRIPFIVKLNHNDFLNYPNTYDQVMFAGVGRAADLGAVGVGATIYFGSEEADRQIVEVSRAFEEAHRLGMFTVLWCYLRNSAFKQGDTDYHVSADLTGQANHLGVTIEADIIKQKQPENNGGYPALEFGRTDPLVYDKLTTDHPIDLTRWQVVNCYAGRIPLINSGGESKGADDLAQAVRTAVINKRAGGAGLIVGRKSFQRPTEEGAALIHAVQDVYLDSSVTIA